MPQPHNPLRNINTDKAYLLGLIVGGGEITGSRLTITLPYRNWGDLKINPGRGGEISGYIVRVAKPMWQSEYNTSINYNVLNNAWEISASVTSELLKDLSELGLPSSGNFRETANLEVLEKNLNNEEKIKRFIAGLTDTIGSLAPSHRHRNENNQIISFEVSGKNFRLVAQLVRLFIAINCYPDQILWNHPNFHSGTNRYYRSWRKGFKLRITLTDYMLKGSFVSEAKKLSATENMALQVAGQRDQDNISEEVKISGRSTLHVDENSDWLPRDIRGKHFIHYAHMGFYLGIPINAQTLNYLHSKFENPGKLINPFTILTKGTREAINEIINSESYLEESTYTKQVIGKNYLSSQLDNANSKNIFGIDNDRGFPVNQIIQAVTYVTLAQIGEGGLMGTRILGDSVQKFREIEPLMSDHDVHIMKPDRGTCLIVQSKDYAALVGYVDSEFNEMLLKVDKQNLVLEVRSPKYSECVVL